MSSDIRSIRKKEISCSTQKKEAWFKAPAKIRAAGVIAACAAVLLTACGGKKSSVDLDLSAMSGNVVYAQVFNIMTKPSPSPLFLLFLLSSFFFCSRTSKPFKFGVVKALLFVFP